MIIYLDTSALIKLYIAEDGTPLVQKAVKDSSLVATSKIAYAEARAAFARAFRENIIKDHVYNEIIAVLKQDWNSYFKLEITDELIELAGELTQTHYLRGFDAIHLSSAIKLSHMLKQKVTTICFDVRLWNALKTYDFFDVLPENCPKK